MGQYTYRVLRQIKPGDEVPEGAVLFVDCGEHDGKTPDAAGLTAAEKAGQRGDYRAISSRHFNLVPIVPQTGFMVAPDEPEPEPEPPATDPDGLCAWSEEGDTCGHLPGDHGPSGSGVCRVEGCPCGKYTPPPAAETLT